jgi:excinuclease UvrABC nuclease subunit
MLPRSIAFDVNSFDWTEIPAAAGVFALFGADEGAEPYISRTPNLRRRLKRFLDPRPDQSKRLQLAGRVTRIEYAVTGSDFEALLQLYEATSAAFGERARKRLHLRTPFFLRMTMENAYPRVYVTNRITKAAADELFGPFASRASAEKFLEEMLNLFELRRCHEELHPDPMFPGCVYSEMKKCLAPCFKGCTEERYATEALAVYDFLATRGQSRVQTLSAEREQASAALDFEKAAEVHARLTKVEAVVAAVSEITRPLSRLSGVIVQPAAEPERVALFLLRKGALIGPVFYSVAGMRHPNEQSGSSSLFAHPVALEAVPLAEGQAVPVAVASRDELERRLDEALDCLERRDAARKTSQQQLADFLCLFCRWYHRPQTKRAGEAIFVTADGTIPSKTVIRAISRVYRQGTEYRHLKPSEALN